MSATMKPGDESSRPDLRQLTKSKIMGKFAKFGKAKDKDRDDEKPTGEHEVSDFLRGSSDKLYMTGASPPKTTPSQLTRIDTSNAARWPTAADVRSVHTPAQHRLVRKGKGLRVHFTNKWPEIIGFGGEDFEEPTFLISQARAGDSTHTQQRAQAQRSPEYSQSHAGDVDYFRPAAIRRTQTGHASVPESQNTTVPELPKLRIDHPSIETLGASGRLRANTEDSQSFAARVKAEMRASEGRDFVKAVRSSHSELNARASFESTRSNQSNGPTLVGRSDSQGSLPFRSNVAAPALPRLQGLPSPSSQQSLQFPILPHRNASVHSESARGVVGQRSRSNSGQSVQSMQSVATVTTDDQALEEFAYRVQNSYKLFALSAESVKPLPHTSLKELVRIASWWFLRGRANIEVIARERPSSASSIAQNDKRLLKEQAHADLAKALWLVTEIIPKCQELGGVRPSEITSAAREHGDNDMADLLERHGDILKHLGKLTSSMRRNNLLPPTPDETPLSSGIDNSIWQCAPHFPADVYHLLRSDGYSDDESPLKHMSVTLSMPLGDTAQIFNYSRTGVNVFLLGEGLSPQQNPVVCMMSISRRPEGKNLCVYLTDQIGIVDLCIQPDRSAGLAWSDIKWQEKTAALDLKLPRGFTARVQMLPADFSTLWRLYDHTQSMSSILQPLRCEEILFDKTIKSFQYFGADAQYRPPFPVDMEYRIRLMEKKATSVSGTGARSTHCGFRVAVLTGPRAKHLNGTSQDLLAQQPIRYDFMRGPTGSPTLVLEFREPTKSRMVMTFSTPHDRARFHHLLIGGVAHDESVFASVTLVSITTATLTGAPLLVTPLETLFLNSSVQVINLDHGGQASSEGSKTVLSENLRIIVSAQCVSLTDRINASSGELLMRLPASHHDLSITMYRQPQSDMTFGMGESQCPRDTPDLIAAYLANIATSSTLRTFKFNTLHDLHSFQAAITGYKVVYDGLSTSLAISRRRMVVPIYKKWDSGLCRIQVVRQEKINMLCAWFEGWSKGECMNFALKETDVFESIGKGSDWGLRIVDAKFALPSGGEEHRSESNGKEVSPWTKGVSFDSPEYPGEHDDILLSFESEAERDSFAAALPAPVKALRKLASVSRR